MIKISLFCLAVFTNVLLDVSMISRLDQMENDNEDFEPLEVAFSDNDEVDPENVDDW